MANSVFLGSNVPQTVGNLNVQGTLDTTGNVTIGGALDVTGEARASQVAPNTITALVRARSTMNNGAGVATGTLTNAPAATNPTKWIPVDDNGTIRHVPAW